MTTRFVCITFNRTPYYLIELVPRTRFERVTFPLGEGRNNL